MNIELFLHIQNTLFNYVEPYPLFEAILQLIPKMGADFGSILLQAEDETIYFRSTIPGREDLVGPAGRRFARKLIAQGLEGHVMRQGKASVIDDVSSNSQWYQADYLIEECRSAAILPISLSKAGARGVLMLASRQYSHYQSANLPELQILSTQIGYAIENTLLYRNQLQRATHLNLINEVSRAATSILNVNLMLTTVTQAIQRSFGFQNVRIYRLMTNAPNHIKLNAVTGSDGRSYSPNQTLSGENRFLDWVVEQGKTLTANDIKIDHRFADYKDNTAIKSKLIIPIKLGVKIIGLLELDSSALDSFSPPLVAALETLSDQLAVAIENARLYDELNASVNELISLNQISQAVSSSLDMQKTLTLIADHVTAMLGVSAASIALRDEATNEIWFAAVSGKGSEAIRGRRMPLGQGIVGWTAQNGQAVIVPNVHQDARFHAQIDALSGFKTRTVMCVPLETKGRLIGAIEVINKLDGAFTSADLQRLLALTPPAATAIENAQLYEELAQRMRQLETTQAQLVQTAKLSAVGELAAGVAHEINNPLTSIFALTKIMLDDIPPQDEHHKNLLLIAQEAHRAKEIVRGLLHFARSEEPKTSMTNLNSLVEETGLLVFTEKVRQNVRVKQNLGELPLICVDQNQIKQVLINIFNNALQSMPNGGEISIITQNKPAQKQVLLSIADSGGGISPDDEAKIFDPFFTTKDVGQGTGLGLSVSYGIIESHNGLIELENRPGQGATFHILLPYNTENQ